MVHALSEIRRVLVPDGILIDLRPILGNWQVEVTSARESRVTGHIQDFPVGLADDEAANQAMAGSEAKGWFIREREESFTFVYSWDTPKEMEAWVAEEWEDFINLDEESRKSTRSIWASFDSDARVQVNMKMLITKWRKTSEVS